MNILVVDVGGTNVKILATGQKEVRKFPSGLKLTARQMVLQVKKLAGATGSTTRCRLAIRARSSATGRLRNRTIWDAAGWGSTLKRRSSGP
jgi:hypothetical protein